MISASKLLKLSTSKYFHLLTGKIEVIMVPTLYGYSGDGINEYL